MRRLLAVLVLAASVLRVRAHADLAIQIDEVSARIETAPAASLYLRRAELLRAHRDWDAAASDYERARALDPALPAVDLGWGRMLLEASRAGEAVPLLRRYLRAVPDDPRGLALLASSLAAVGRAGAAAATWDRALDAAAPSEPLRPDWLRGRDEARRAAGLPPRGFAARRVAVRPPAPPADEPQPFARLLRGPYLQLATPHGIVVRWRTDLPTDSAVAFGVSPGPAARRAVDRTRVVDHVVPLTGLAPGRRYVYTVGSSSQVLAGGDDATAFTAPPPAGKPTSTRVWVLGDSGTADDNAARVRDAFLAYSPSRDPDVWLMLGDNAYESGTDDEYQRAVFEMHAPMLRRVALWPTLGNHDGYSADSESQSGPYYDAFTLPRSAEAGGVASTTEAYYSFDHANIHFVCLDSYGSRRDPGSPMLDWLARDLAATAQPWIIAFWHHPPYSKGSHDSDDEPELIEMRENVLPILEARGVDLILSGHSHSYERSVLLDGHYGPSWTFQGAYVKDGGDGRPDGDGAYRKPPGAAASHAGAVYAVAGSSGQTSGGALDHPAMWISLDTLGSMVLDVDGAELDAAFLDDAGAVRDRFTILKGRPWTR